MLEKLKNIPTYLRPTGVLLVTVVGGYYIGEEVDNPVLGMGLGFVAGAAINAVIDGMGE